MKKIIKNVIAVILLLIGVAGGFIPILQGWMFVLSGYILLDFKKKDIFERKIIDFLKKRSWSRRLALFWEKIKDKNRHLIDDNKDKKVKKIFRDIDRDIK